MTRPSRTFLQRINNPHRPWIPTLDLTAMNTHAKSGQIIFNEHILYFLEEKNNFAYLMSNKNHGRWLDRLASHVYLALKCNYLSRTQSSLVSLKNMILIPNNYTDQHFMAGKVVNNYSALSFDRSLDHWAKQNGQLYSFSQWAGC